MFSHFDIRGLIRRFCLALVIVVLLSFTSICIGLYSVDAQTDSEWPMFRHDLNHSGYSTSTAPTTNNVLWSYPTEGAVFSSPAVVSDRVYVGL